jgi:DNA-binding transcriptional LysR family regulator
MNLTYLKYFVNSAELGSLVKAAELNFVTSSAVSQSIKWLEEFYQLSLIEHGKNKFILTQKGLMVVKEAKLLLESAEKFNQSMKKIVSPSFSLIKLSMQQSIANSVVAKAIHNFNIKCEQTVLQVRIGTSPRCRELLASGEVPYSISIDNVSFNAHQKNLYSGKFVFISAKDDTRSPEDAGFILTEDTAEVLALKKNYFKRFHKNIPIRYSISSWGVITNMALGGNGIAYIPDYYLRELDRSKYRLRKIDVETASYKVNFYYSKNAEFSSVHQILFDEVRKQFNL